MDKNFVFAYSPSTQQNETVLRRFFRHFDWVLFLNVLILSLIGLVVIYSASSRFGHPGYFFGKQLAALVMGLLTLFILSTLNYQIFAQYSKTIFWISISLLLLVLAAGSTFHGTKAWLVFGPIAFQPSEISKLLVILVLAGWCEKNLREMRQFKGFLIPVTVVLAHVGLIMLQPDFGSTLVYFPIFLSMIYVAGAQIVYLFSILIYGFTVVGIVLLHTGLSLSPIFVENHVFWNTIYKGLTLGKEFFFLQVILASVFALAWWLTKQLRFRLPGIYYIFLFLLIFSGCFSSAVFVNKLKDYQRKRLIAFFNPQIDPMGSGYHVIQSVIALGSGKIFGKGLFSGTQGRLGFLPEQHTDFIFSVLGEETGFLASGFVLLLYLLLVWRAIAIAGDARDIFGSLVAAGIGSMFAFYALLNLAMVMGLAPVTGLPLPFLSYGGSALFSSLAATGILLSIHVHRYTY